MSYLLPLAALGALFAFTRGGDKADSGKASKKADSGKASKKADSGKAKVKADVKEIVKEADEIIKGKRDAFTPDDSSEVNKAIQDLIDQADAEKPEPKKVEPKKVEPKKVEPKKVEPKKVEPKPSADPVQAPLPAGYDPVGARNMAPSLARHIKAKGRAGYDRRLTRDFQVKAGLTPDGIYAGGTRGALLFYGGKEAPPALFPPLDTQAYVRPEDRYVFA